MIAKYYIAQTIPNLFRREQINVGVIACKGERIAAKFLGERSQGAEIDKRNLKKAIFPYKDVYTQWVSYWRRMISTSSSPLDDILNTDAGNYRVISGGEVDRTGEDPIEDIVDYLFPLIVSNGVLSQKQGGICDIV